MTATTHITAGIAFLAGLVSFVSPCVLPLVPAYLSLLTGESVEDLQVETTAQARVQTLAHALAFVVGFSLIFIALGLSASALGSALAANRSLIAQIGGVIVVVLGLHMMGMIRIPWLMMDARVHLRHDRATFWTSGLVGMAFAAGWSPCIGPILAGILAIASQQHSSQAAFLLASYCIGLAVPFLLTAGAIGAVLPVLRRIAPSLRAIEFGAGAFLIVVGLVLVNDAFLNVAGWFYQFVPQPSL
ncbi:MAG: cytochrome c biogenesis protein CcdA [Candidatus Eremiobacteraeota bacterium]|nr:cytochrome c biogenesis protein CcdA [Candidatus Eremiobacteraeota bacterium]